MDQSYLFSKGTRMLWREVETAGVKFVETLESHLTRNSLLHMAEDVAGVNSSSFINSL